MNDLEAIYSPDQFLAMTFYLSGSYSIPQGTARAGWYGFSGTPSVTFDGTVDHVGGQPSGSMFATYQPGVVTRMGTSSPVIINAAYVALGNDFSVSATIQVDEPVSGANNQVLFFICQEGYHGQSNMVVDMLPAEDFDLTSPGQSTVVSRDFVLEHPFNENDLRIIVLVQNMDTQEVLQAGLATADYAGTIVVDAEPDGVEAPWRLQGPEGLDLLGYGDRTLNMFYTGDYTLTFLEVPGWTAPETSVQSQILIDDGTLTFSGTYSDGPFATVLDGPVADDGTAEGASLVDFDGDGDLDIHVLNNDGADQLLRNDGNLVFSDAATGLIADTGSGRSSAWADFNRDGHQDVYLGRDGEANLLLLGDGSGGFSPGSIIGVDDTGSASSVAWVDYNLDGNLDLYVSRTGQNNLLLENYGDLGGGFFLFTGVADGSTVASSSGADWVDLNGDQRPELHITNDLSPNQLLENTEIGFSDISNASNLNDLNAGMGSAWGDYDNDGDWDLYLANEGMADQLYRNSGDMSFNQTGGELTTDNGQGRGVVWADFDQDGFLDIYLVRRGQPDLFLIGDGTGGFERIPVGVAAAEGPGNAVACGDLDGDGDLDLFVTHQGEGNVIFENRLAEGNFLQLSLVGSELQPDAVGAVARVTAGGQTMMRQVRAGGGYQAMDARTLHFGLGESGVVDSVEIIWPDGTVQTLGTLAANQFMQVTKGESNLSPVGDNPLPRKTALGLAHPNPFNPSTTIEFALAQDGPTHLEIYTVDGRRVRTLVAEDLPAGHHQVVWQGRDDAGRPVASGTYFYRLAAADGSLLTGRMALVK